MGSRFGLYDLFLRSQTFLGMKQQCVFLIAEWMFDRRINETDWIIEILYSLEFDEIAYAVHIKIEYLFKRAEERIYKHFVYTF